MSTDLEQIIQYHQRTKHHLHGYAKGPEFLDWENQPDPIRRFQDTELIPLPLIAQQLPDAQMRLLTLAALLELAMGLSAWKQFGPDRWALRNNPSSGNLHPTETYIIANAIDDIPDGVYHYLPYEHALEKRAKISSKTSEQQLLIGLSSIIWREAWKYGERAFRYVQLDTGHALGALRYACEALGVNITLITCPDKKLSTLLGLDRKSDFTNCETEIPEVLLSVQLNTEQHPIHWPRISQWYGHANALGGFPKHHWKIIDQAVRASTCHSAETVGPAPEDHPVCHHNKQNFPGGIQLAQLIKQRRSAQAFRGKSSIIAVADFYSMLNALLPLADHSPWDLWVFPVRIHLVLFVHRISGLEPGLYLLPRRANVIDSLQTAMKDNFDWQKPETCPAHIPLFQLQQADARKAARALSCHQEIASSSAFSLSMLAEFDHGLSQGAHIYRHMHWEAGLIGQTLYLQAEAIGKRGTGIGCFFDDAVHELLGLDDTCFQSLYHFTVGDPKHDARLETLPPYSHLPENRHITNNE